MFHDQRSPLSGYISHLLSMGRIVFTANEAVETLGVGRGAFLDAAERLQQRKALLRVRQGFYFIVPPQFASWGAPPPAWFIDDLMDHECTAYYVGLLKAAEFHGTAHQGVMEFQVVSAKRLPKIQVGRSLIVTYYRKDMDTVAMGIKDRKTDTGKMKVSSAALTALDLLRYPQASAGIDNIITVLSDLSQEIDADQLTALSVNVERPVVQRLGHLLDRLGHENLTRSMLSALQARGTVPWTELDRNETRDPDFMPDPRENDACWRVIVRHVPEIDD